jgi:hypothetical protein
MKRFIRTRKTRHLEKFLSNLFTERDEFAFEFLQKVLPEFEMDFTPVPTIDSSVAKKITTPITIFAAKKDVIFPGEKMLRRARGIFPSLKDAILMEDSKHVQDKSQNESIVKLIMAE